MALTLVSSIKHNGSSLLAGEPTACSWEQILHTPKWVTLNPISIILQKMISKAEQCIHQFTTFLLLGKMFRLSFFLGGIKDTAHLSNRLGKRSLNE